VPDSGQLDCSDESVDNGTSLWLSSFKLSSSLKSLDLADSSVTVDCEEAALELARGWCVALEFEAIA